MSRYSRNLMISAASLLLLISAVACSVPAGDDVSPKSPTEGSGASVDGTAAAQASLQEFFRAWQAKDEDAANRYLAANRQGINWQFAELERVEFGPVTPSPEWITDYMSHGLGSVSGVESDDVRCFSADVTFYYESEDGGATPSGEALGWHWFLEREESGEWLVTDWGY